MANRPTSTKLLPTAAGSPPQQDVFTGRSSSFSAMESTIWNLSKADDNLCGCGKVTRGLGQIVGCGKSIDCGRDDYYKCYLIQPVTTDINGNSTVGSAVFACIRSRFVLVRREPPLYEITPWKDGQYTNDPSKDSRPWPRYEERRLEDGAKPVWRNPGGLGSTQA